MATYVYRCSHNHSFDVALPIGRAPLQVTCEACGTDAGRVYTAPMVAGISAGIAALHQLEERSRHEPAVVSAPAGAARHRQPVSRNPLHARLPRP